MAQERALSTAGRDVSAAFDTAAARDDQQYRARDTERPQGDERSAASAAWGDAQRQEKERARGVREQRQKDLQEKHRRAWLDARRAEAWDRYQAQRWQSLDDKQTERREGLRQLQAAGQYRFDIRLDRKYAESEALLGRHLHEAQVAGNSRGLRALLDRVTGAAQAQEAERAARQDAVDSLARQKAAERTDYEARQRAQRDAQARRQEEERQVFARRLAATKARQDAKFEEQERTRTERVQQRARGADSATAAAWAKAARDQVTAAVNERAARARGSEIEDIHQGVRDWDVGY